ncbi:MAG: hypothetical protein HY079_07915 [Elusimicrobia bacterium]|nr:hypothetical protein [Elusimicrobiota bacterium]
MSDEPSPRGGRLGWIVTGVAVLGSFVGVVGWYLVSNRGGGGLDTSGFDIATAPSAPRPVAAAPAAPPPGQPRSSLDMMKADAGIRIVDSNSSSGSPGSSGPAAPSGPEQKKQESHASFTENARKHEGDVRRFAEKMTAKYPVIRQYGRDWMSYPDLKKLNDDYARNHDPIAFMIGLSKAPNLGTMLKKYAGKPEIREFVVDGMKQAPGDLTGSAMSVLQNDRVLKDLISNVTGSLGLPPSITAMIGSGDPSKMDQNKMMKDVMNTPDIQKAMQGQGQQPPPPVNLGR